MTKKIVIKIAVILMLIAVIKLFYPCLAFGQGNGLYEFIGRNGKHGFMDKTGKVIIPAKYVNVYFKFSEGLAFVSEKRTSNGDFIWICIDTLGNKKFSLGRKYAPEECFSEGYAVIENWFSDCYLFVDKDGKKVFDKKFDDACNFTNGFACVCNKDFNDCHFINKRGQYAQHFPIPCK